MNKLLVCVGMWGETMWGNSDPAAQGIDVYASYDRFCDMVEAELRKLYPDVANVTVEYDEDEARNQAIIDDEQDADAAMIETIADVTNRVHGIRSWVVYKERDFWGNPDTVNLYEDNAGGLYIGESSGPWFRMDNSAGKTTFTNDASNYTRYVGSEDWGPEAAEETSPVSFTKLVAEYRDGRTRYSHRAYARSEYGAGSAAPGLAARAYVGPDAEGYEPNE